MRNKNESKRHHVIFNITLDKIREIMFKNEIMLNHRKIKYKYTCNNDM